MIQSVAISALQPRFITLLQCPAFALGIRPGAAGQGKGQQRV